MSVQIDKACNISRFADVDTSRYALGGVYWDEEHKAFAATDSRVLAVVPPPESAEPQTLGESVIIPSGVFSRMALLLKGIKESWNAALSLASMRVRLSLSYGIAEESIEHRPVQGRFPRFPDVLPPRSAFDREYTIDARLLKRVADYFVEHGSEEYHHAVCMRIGSKPGMSVEFSGLVGDELRVAYVIVMPLSSDDEMENRKLSDRPTASEAYPMPQPAVPKQKRKKAAKKK